MNLSDYIAKHGEAKCAALFRASIHTIKSWRYGQRNPRPDKANEIVAATGGEVSMSGIYAKTNH